MSRLIRVYQPTGDELDQQFTRRLDYFAGRHLGNQEFRLEQMYRDDRLRWLLEGRRAGIVHGLEIDVPMELEGAKSLSSLGRFRIRPGLGLGEQGLVLTLTLPLPVAWFDLLKDWKSSAKLETIPDGLYLMDLEREEQDVDPQTPSDPCRRDEADPLRDERIEWVAQARLRGPLANIGPVNGVNPWRLANRCAALLLGRSFADRTLYSVASGDHSKNLTADGVVVAVCAISNGKPLWIDQTPVRRTREAHADARALRNQASECLRAVVDNNPPSADVDAWAKKLITDGKLPLEWLPAAGELPIELLIYPKDAIEEEGKPWCPLFRNATALDLVPVRESVAPSILERELGRGPIRLAGNDRVRLLVAVADQDWRPDLLDVPPPDFDLIKSLNLAYITAYDCWINFRKAYLALYGITSLRANDAKCVSITKNDFTPVNELSPFSRTLVLSRDGLSALGIAWTVTKNSGSETLVLLDQNLPPQKPDQLRSKIVAEKTKEYGAIIRKDDLPEPYDDDFENETTKEEIKGLYRSFDFWNGSDGTKRNWNSDKLPVPTITGTSVEFQGALVQVPLLRQYLDWLERETNARTSTLDALRDLLLALRQKLDSHTLNLASISGGIATDGSGMRLARWSPYVSFKGKAAAITAPATPPPASDTPPTNNTFMMLPRQLENRMLAAPAVKYAERAAITNKVQFTNLSGLKAVAASGIFNRVPLFNASQDALAIPKDASPISPPGFTTSEESFGVISNISPEVYALEELDRGLTALATTINALVTPAGFGLSFTPELATDSLLTLSTSIMGSLKRSIDIIKTQDADTAKTTLSAYLTKVNATLIDARLTSLVTYLKAAKSSDQLIDELIATKASDTNFDLAITLHEGPPDLKKATTTALRYEWMMAQGRKLVEGIAKVEAERRRREETIRSFISEREAVNERLVTLQESLPKLRDIYQEAREALDEATRDYAMAQGELIRDWQAVELRDAERTRILTQPRGLYYVRTRPVALSQSLADPLPLTRKDADDVVPGCDAHHDLPDDLDDFVDALWEVPVADFAVLKPLLPTLPDRLRIATWLDRRDVRLQSKTNRVQASTTGTVRAKLAPLAVQNQAMYRSQIGVRARFSDSLREFQQEAGQVLSLTDVLSGQRGPLRSATEILRSQCEQVIGCLVAQLESALPSLRYEWAQLAEDDRLAVDNAERWPGLDRLAERSFLTARTLVDTVRWLFAQLHADGGGTGRTALRNLVRAAVIATAHGDPSMHIRGPVLSAPPQLRPGSLLRVALNREARPGTRLHLFDQDHRVVGEVQVDDHDAQGAVVSLISSTSSTLSISTRFSVMQIKN